MSIERIGKCEHCGVYVVQRLIGINPDRWMSWDRSTLDDGELYMRSHSCKKMVRAKLAAYKAKKLAGAQS